MIERRTKKTANSDQTLCFERCPMEKNCEVAIPSKSNRVEPRDYDRHLYKARHLIENFFAKLKQYRAISLRHGYATRLVTIKQQLISWVLFILLLLSSGLIDDTP